MSGFDPQTLAFYAREASTYLSKRPEDVEPYLPEFLDSLAPGAQILDMGCGGGRNAEYMIERGFVVDPTDGVAEMAAQAEARLGAPVRVMRFDELESVAQYDAVVACAALLHVPRDGLPDILGRIWRALKPGGLHFATYKTGGIEGRDDHGRYYNYPDRAVLESAYNQGGQWAEMDIIGYEGVGYFSAPCSWLRIIVRKP